MGVPYTPYAVDGALITDVTGQQIPLFQQVNADPAARYDLGCLYIGTNDIRLPEWDPTVFRAEFDLALAFLAHRCERLLCPTIPQRMGRPPNPERIAEVNAIILSGAAQHHALVLDLFDFGARNTLMSDHVHPTAHGQVAIAERALAVLAADGVEVRLHPTQLMRPFPSRGVRRIGDATYVYRVTRDRVRQAYWTWRGAIG
jgi:lysophospholipase L1-like esterase